jgi:CheY-like chemotaxis protein
MAAPELTLSGENLEHLLLQYKYHTAVRRVARGVAHNYNNIFTGLGGQTAILRQESHLPEDLGEKRGHLIEELLQRGINQTAILYGFTLDDECGSCNQSPLSLASRAMELLNTISRIHRFVLQPAINQEKIVGNGRDLILLLFYLGENCIDATPDGDEISLSISREASPGSQLAFAFKDHGPGFPGVTGENRCTPFRSSTSDAPHRGLGLYAARTLAERYNGRLAFGRAPDGTTVVSAVFPVAAENMATPDVPRPSPPVRQGNVEPAKQCFLVVEDDEAMRKLLLNRLQRRGHMVFCVDTCTEALEEYGCLHDIITTVLMDVGLRDGSGYECQRKLLAINPGARIIFMSGQHEMAPLGVAGKSVFLQKPFTLDQLETAVHDVHL